MRLLPIKFVAGMSALVFQGVALLSPQVEPSTPSEEKAVQGELPRDVARFGREASQPSAGDEAGSLLARRGQFDRSSGSSL